MFFRNVLRRNKAIKSFRAKDSTIKVIMLSLENAASGTNLIEATHIILMGIYIYIFISLLSLPTYRRSCHWNKKRSVSSWIASNWQSPQTGTNQTRLSTTHTYILTNVSSPYNRPMFTILLYFLLLALLRLLSPSPSPLPLSPSPALSLSLSLTRSSICTQLPLFGSLFVELLSIVCM